jgi:hypothetical protein
MSLIEGGNETHALPPPSFASFPLAQHLEHHPLIDWPGIELWTYERLVIKS